MKYPVFPPWTGVDPMAFLDPAFEEMELTTAQFLIFLSVPLDTCQRAHHTGKLPGWGQSSKRSEISKAMETQLSSSSLWPTAAFQSLAPDSPLPFIEPDSFCSYLHSQIRLHHSVEKSSCQFNLAEAFLVLDRQPLSPEHGLQSSPVTWFLETTPTSFPRFFLITAFLLIYLQLPAAGFCISCMLCLGHSSYLCAWVSTSLYSSLCANVGISNRFFLTTPEPLQSLSLTLWLLLELSVPAGIICIEYLFRCFCSSTAM